MVTVLRLNCSFYTALNEWNEDYIQINLQRYFWFHFIGSKVRGNLGFIAIHNTLWQSEYVCCFPIALYHPHPLIGCWLIEGGYCVMTLVPTGGMGLCHSARTEKQRASRTKTSMRVDGKWMWRDMGEPGARDLSRTGECLPLHQSEGVGGGSNFLLTCCEAAGKAQVILSYPGEVPVPSRNACSSLPT